MPKEIRVSKGIIQVTFPAGMGPGDFPGQLPDKYQAVYSDEPGDRFFVTDTSNTIQALTGEEVENLPTPNMLVVCESSTHRKGPFRVARVHFEPLDSPSGLGGTWVPRGPGAQDLTQIAGPGGRIEENERGPVSHRSVTLECPKCRGNGAKVRLRGDLWEQLLNGLMRQHAEATSAQGPGEMPMDKDLTISLTYLSKLAGGINRKRRT